ncbi:MAG: hypothetical protein LBE22_07700 [Azoarcus sp.]|jgi:hypothetical protein|nr:hypothetical protein [Azoarcus sp.]
MSGKSFDITYALSKQVPNMVGGFVIQTDYGDIRIEADETAPVMALIEQILLNRMPAAGIKPHKIGTKKRITGWPKELRAGDILTYVGKMTCLGDGMDDYKKTPVYLYRCTDEEHVECVEARCAAMLPIVNQYKASLLKMKYDTRGIYA